MSRIPAAQNPHAACGVEAGAVRAQIRQIEKNEWWLWSLSTIVTLLLTGAIASFLFPVLRLERDAFYWFNMNQAVRGLAGLVLLFNIYTVYLQLQLQRMRRRLHDEEELFRLISENAADMIALVDVQGRRLYTSPAYQSVLGYSAAELAATSAFEQIHPEDQPRVMEAAEEIRRTGLGRRLEYRIRHKEGGWRVLESTASVIRNSQGETEKLIIVNHDITDRRQAEERVRFLAYYDALTGLPNRMLLQDRLSKALASAQRRREKVALLFLDIDRFKTINDSLGHSAGDLLLKELADAAVAAHRIMTVMTPEFVIQDHMLSISCSLGISVFPDDGTDSEAMIRNADTAMYSAKENGRNNFQFFTPDMNVRAVERLNLESGLRLALERREFFLVYQPQVDIATGKIIGAEALLRWRHPELGLVPPQKFIPIAENNGLIFQIGEWVLKTACAQARKWQDEGLPQCPSR